LVFSFSSVSVVSDSSSFFRACFVLAGDSFTFWHRQWWWFCCIVDGVRCFSVSDLVCWCFSFGAAEVGVVVTDLWLHICFRCVLVGDGFGVVSDLVLRWACWWLVEEVLAVFGFGVAGICFRW
jgi:hypothetical protein